MEKHKIIVLSDVHIGDNSAPVWYNQGFHQPFLSRILQYVLDGAAEISELVLLGDIVDFWTYPPDKKPPAFLEIAAANPVIFGPEGLFNQVLDALDGRVTYVAGNHDMGVTQDDLDQIGSRYKMHLAPDYIYYPEACGRRIACTHGNHFTLFNHPYTDPSGRITPLPIGHFITRSIAHKREQEGKPAFELEDSGDPTAFDLFPGIIEEIAPYLLKKKNLKNFSLTDTALEIVADSTGVKEDQVFILPNGTPVTLREALSTFDNLLTEWIDQYGYIETYKSLMADSGGNYLGWFSQRLAFPENTELVVMGHTHKPLSGLSDSLIQYVNTGFNCPSKPDTGKRNPTFIEIEMESCAAKNMECYYDNGHYGIRPFIAEKTTVYKSPSLGDYSCYVIIDNSKGTTDLKLKNQRCIKGTAVVAPPAVVKKGTQPIFWLEDMLWTIGSEGTAAYTTDAGGRDFIFNYRCLPLLGNRCSAGNTQFITKAGSGEWEKPGVIAVKGHPFFVKFLI